MERLLEILKVIFLGIVEGITEWLPISSTGHMLLVDEFIKVKEDPAFMETFFIVIQLGAILAVVLLFWNRMFPFQFKSKEKPVIRKDVFSLWFKVVVACIPGAAITLLFDDFIEEHFHTPTVIAAALILYGLGFLFVEKWNKARAPRVSGLENVSYKDALLIGLFQVLSIIPGTSRSGSTILGGLILGVDRTTSADFTFFLAVPVMAGYSLLKLLKFGFDFTAFQLVLLLAGCLTAFLVSLVVIKLLLSYIKKRDFAVFGWYRIILGALVLGWFLLIK
ncbi:MAG: undecaprenyl-diphosphate phosphatase [Clostridia bacterium]|nr:undecaprenyl-diphosphate phosphatase [Clostridia bacterium]